MPRLVLTLWALALGTCATASADGIIQTLIGSKVVSGIPAVGTSLGSPSNLAVSTIGNIFYTDTAHNVVRKIDVGTGLLTTVAGTGQAGYSGDSGQATQAQLSGPTGLGLYSGALYVADTGNNVIRQIMIATGVINTVAGNSDAGYSGDGGPPLLASLSKPSAVAVSTDGSEVWFVDQSGAVVRAFSPGSGSMQTVAGTTDTAATGVDGGPAVDEYIAPALSVAAPADGSLYIGGYQRVSKVYLTASGPVAAGTITNVAGTNTTTTAGTPVGSLSDGVPALSAAVGDVDGITEDSLGNLVFSSSYNANPVHGTLRFDLVRRIDAASQLISTVAGTVGSIEKYSGDGLSATAAGLNAPSSLGFDAYGNLFFIDFQDVRRVDAVTQVISTIGGGADTPPVGGSIPASQFSFTVPVGPVPGPTPTDLLVANFNPVGDGGQVFLYHAASGLLSLYAGTGDRGTTGDGGPATAATFGNINALSRDGAGNLYIADNSFPEIRQVDVGSGNVTRVAGTGTKGYSNDNGPATSAQIGVIAGMACAPGWLYLADQTYNSIRAVDTNTGVISLLAGAGPSGVSGSANGAPAAARFYFSALASMAVDAAGNLYVADPGNNAVRKISLGSATPTVSTVAGLGYGLGGYNGDGGLAVASALNLPTGVWLDSAGDLFIADMDSSRVRRVAASTGIISTVVGGGIRGYSGDGGPALLSELDLPATGFVDAQGNLYLNDKGNSVIRKVDYVQSPTPTPVAGGSGKLVAYPSPTNSQVCFSYFTDGPGPVSIAIYNMGFQKVARFEDVSAGAGPKVTCGDVSRLATGAYICRLSLPGGQSLNGKFKVIH